MLHILAALHPVCVTATPPFVFKVKYFAKEERP
jgi:hypothetical protein